MKKAIYQLAGLALVLTLASPAWADFAVQEEDVYRISNGGPSWLGGGPFNMEKKLNGTYGDPWYTFCAEKSETISTPGEFEVAGVGKTSLDKYGNQYTLQDYGAWVYQQYHAEDLDESHLDDNDLNNAVQSAIWWSMVNDDGNNQLGYEDTDFSTWEGSYNGTHGYDTELGTFALAYNDYSQAGDVDVSRVVVMNLQKDGAPVQDMVGIAPIPEPTTIAIWSLLGVAAIGLARYRRRK